MLEGGADVRYIQAILGHARLDTTMIYTCVGIRRLAEIHAATHPGVKIIPSLEASREGEGVGEEEE
jgi:integrase/recombinase XerD